MGSKQTRRRRRTRRTLEKALTQYKTTLLWAQEREAKPEGVVCEKCGLEQPYVLGSRCRRGQLLGISCDSNMCITHEHHAELMQPDII